MQLLPSYQLQRLLEIKTSIRNAVYSLLAIKYLICMMRFYAILVVDETTLHYILEASDC